MELGLLAICIAFSIATIVISVVNGVTWPKLSHAAPANVKPFVSILIPARNEEHNIGKCVVSVLAQDYPNFEVVVLDDNSEDSTRAILESFAAKDSRVRILKGSALPEGWFGKSWACHQLSQAAKGEIFLFIDADVELSSSALDKSVSAMESGGADFLSLLTSQRLHTVSEKLIMRFILGRCFHFFRSF